MGSELLDSSVAGDGAEGVGHVGSLNGSKTTR